MTSCDVVYFLQGEERELFDAIGRSFWPGGVTIVAPAKPHVPEFVCANSSTVGVRVPSHPVALKLLQSAGVPVAAPSANLFGHVSPTTASHVLADLSGEDIAVLKGQEDETGDLGIESTVCKISGGGSLEVLRLGAVSVRALKSALLESGLSHIAVNVRVHHAQIPVPKKTPITVKEEEDGDGGLAHSPASASLTSLEEETYPPLLSSPGQLLTHYAPHVPASIIKRDDDGKLAGRGEGGSSGRESIGDSVIIDFGGSMKDRADEALGYRDLSANGDTREAQRSIFGALRWAESVPGARHVLLPDVEALAPADDEHVSSLADRLFRSASGRFVHL
eukprot:CAMPEP_0185748206 /NCGR_PEP_ID=MMETSP1174-20130828/6880_1 /TAXON_ID=35687 /ORGANISM="Dictyocha speculum, Strain CCMP1381" /LENGTH=334 /DNA_ID=CAMNT_0028423753 /DNA_START=616 /DNA_END=1620 /DNA_ORIENTATION=-